MYSPYSGTMPISTFFHNMENPKSIISTGDFFVIAEKSFLSETTVHLHWHQGHSFCCRNCTAIPIRHVRRTSCRRQTQDAYHTEIST